MNDISPSGVNPRPPRRSNSAKAKAIVAAARQCFLEKGYGATSMDLVAATAQVSKATVYAHYGSKQELFGAFLTDQCESHAKKLGGIALDDIKTGEQAIELLVRHIMKRSLDPASLAVWRIVTEESYRHPELAQVFYNQGQKRGRVLMGEKLEHLAKRGLLKIDNGFEAADLAIGMVRGDYYNRALFGLPLGPDEDLEHTIQVVIRALRKLWG